MNRPRMECHISSGPQEPGDLPSPDERDEDAEYERMAQEELDDAFELRDALIDIATVPALLRKQAG